MHTPSHEPDLHILAKLERIEPPALILVAAVVGCILLFWAFPPLAALAPAGWSGMKATTATGILIAAISLALSAPRRSTLAVRASMVAGFAPVVVPLLVVLSDITNIHFHPERWPTHPPPATATAIAIALSMECLPFIRRSKDGPALVADLSAIFLVAFVLFLLSSYVFNVVEFVGVDQSNLTSPQTIVCLGLLAFVICGRRAAEGGLLGILVNMGIGSQIARRVLPAVIAVPFIVFEAMIWFERSGLATSARSQAIAAPLVAMATLVVMTWMGRTTNDIERQLRQQSLTDQLTGVLNRRGFDTVAEYVRRNSERSGSRLVAFFFDLDGLKLANDALGHEAGSLVIQRFADLLVVTFRKSDVVARIGGDEFVVLAPGPPDSAEDILARLDRLVAASNASGMIPSASSYSVGYAGLPPGTAGSIEDLVAEADARMYAEKSRKRAACAASPRSPRKRGPGWRQRRPRCTPLTEAYATRRPETRRRSSTASASLSSTSTELSQPMQPSVMLWP